MQLVYSSLINRKKTIMKGKKTVLLYILFIRGPGIVYNNLIRTTYCIRRQNCLQNKYNNNNNNKK